MKLRTWKYYIRQGLSGVTKNGLMSLASIVIVAACAFIVILSLCIVSNINYILEQVESKVGVVLFMGNKPTDEQVMELKTKIEGMDHVVSVEYKSAEEALDDYGKEMNLNFDTFKDDNPLPRSLSITIDDINSQDWFVTQLENLQWDFEKELLHINDDGTPVVESSTVATTQAVTQATTVAQTQATTQPQTQVVTNAPIQQQTINAPKTQEGASQATTVAQTQATTTQPTTLAGKNEAEQPTGESPNKPKILTQPTTKAVSNGEPVIGDPDYVFQGIERIKHAQQITDALVTIDTVCKIVSIVIIAILCMVAIGIIMNTIKLTVFIRKNEINIMKYVGATDWFIRWPFIIEGVVIGIIGALIPTGLCWFGYMKLAQTFNQSTIFTAIGQLRSAEEIFVIIAPVTMAVGVLLGAIGSINSIRKHLKV